jgi:hypothetical protein
MNAVGDAPTPFQLDEAEQRQIVRAVAMMGDLVLQDDAIPASSDS